MISDRFYVGKTAALPNTEVLVVLGKASVLTVPAGAAAEDACEQYGTGPVVTLAGGVAWADVGLITNLGAQQLLAQDDVETLAEGAVTALNGGSGWNGNGVFG